MNKLVIIACTAALALQAAVTVQLLSNPAPQPTYSLVMHAHGDAYVLDHDMSADDCHAAATDGLLCEVER